MERTVPVEIKKRLDSWNRLATSFRLLHIALGLVGVICPLIVASFADAFSIFQLRILSFSGAAAIAIFAAFEVGSVANRFRESWKLLNAVAIEFELGIVDQEALVKAYREGEVKLGPMKANPFEKSEGTSDAGKQKAPRERLQT